MVEIGRNAQNFQVLLDVLNKSFKAIKSDGPGAFQFDRDIKYTFYGQDGYTMKQKHSPMMPRYEVNDI